MALVMSYNQFEVASGALVGTVENVEDGQIITIVITDSQGVAQEYT